MGFVPPGEKIVETKKCRISGEEFIVTDKDLEFYDKISPVFGGKKYAILSPTFSPIERQKRRLAFRNERNLYLRKCDKTGQDIVSVYSPDKPYTVYDQKVWWSDDWSPLEYGQSIDFDVSFFSQFQKLSLQVPVPNLLTVNNENSPYAQYAGESKNIYMSADVWFCRDTYYSTTVKHVENSIDIYDTEYAQYCYECAFSKRINHCQWAVRSHDCTDCSFVFNCKHCNNCLFCWGLISKNYHIYNKPVSKEEFERVKKSIFDSQENLKKAKQAFSELFHTCTIKENWNVNCENCIGDDLSDSKNCYMCFDAVGIQDCKYCVIAYNNKNCYDTTIYNPGSEWTIEGICGGVNLYFSGYTYSCLDMKDGWYTWGCLNTDHLFGCIGLHSHEHHCIFNKSYSVNEYEELCGKIIDHMRSTGEWGEFFPHELSPFGYNETVSNEYFPMTESEVRARGWNWYTEETKTYDRAQNIVPLPIREYDEKQVGFEQAQKHIDTLLSGTILCEITKKPFKIIKQELAFYIENALPIPTKHPDQRHKERMDLRNPRDLHERQCAECGKNIVTTYNPSRPEKVICEQCYKKIVY